MAALKEVVPMYQRLTQEWSRKPPDLKSCGIILNQLKVKLIELSFLPTHGSTVSSQELLLARDILETGAQWAIAQKDIPTFERYMSQLKCYYFDYQNDLPESPFKYQLLGINLLRLLAQNRLAEFHTEIELLPAKDIYSNVYIKHPISLEQYLMEGSYNKVFLAKGNVPAENYNFFMDMLLNTIRDEIAACMEKAYERIAFSEASRMLFFDTLKQMQAYSQERGWTMSGDSVFNFHREAKKSDDNLHSEELATQAIEYARELEMIV